MPEPRCTVPGCEQPDRPIHDNAYACVDCGRALTHALQDAAIAAGEAWTTIARLDRITRPVRLMTSAADGDDWLDEPYWCTPDCCPPHGRARLGRHPEFRKVDPRGALAPTQRPDRHETAEVYDAAVLELQTWARHITEETGRSVTSAVVKQRPGSQAIDETRYQEHPLRLLCAWLGTREQVDWLRHRPEADEALPGLQRVARAIVRVVDRPPDREFVGRCGCNTDLYRIAGRGETVVCQGCGTGYDADTLRKQVQELAGDQLYTPAEIATWAVVFGIPTRRDRVRDLIRKWGKRGHLVRHEYPGEDDGVYRLDEALARLGGVRAG